jgi:Icc-related predicted phosphoesterase
VRLVLAGETDVDVLVIAGPLAKEEVNRPPADDEPFGRKGGHSVGRTKDGLEAPHA